MFLVSIFFSLIVIFEDLKASGPIAVEEISIKKISNQTEENTRSDNNKNNLEIIKDFFKSAQCKMTDYNPDEFLKKRSLNQKKKLRKKLLKACFIDISRFKKKSFVLDYIKDSKNWTKKQIAADLYNAYSSSLDREIIIKENHLIIYSFSRELRKIIKDNYCNTLDINMRRTLKESSKGFLEGEYYKNGCYMSLNDDRFSEEEIREYYKKLLFENNNLQNEFFKYISENQQHNFSIGDKIIFISNKKDDHKIYLIKTTKDKKEAFKSSISNIDLYSTCNNLRPSDILFLESDPRFPLGKFINKGCSAIGQEHGFIKGNGTFSEFESETEIDNFFKSQKQKADLLEQFSKKHKAHSKKTDLDEIKGSPEDIFILSRLEHKGSGEYKIYILNTTEDKKEALKSSMLRNLNLGLYIFRSLEEDISDKIPQGHILKQSYIFKIQDPRLKTNGSLSSYYNEEQLNKYFKELNLKSDFIKRVNSWIESRRLGKKPNKLKSFNPSQTKIEIKLSNSSEGELKVYIIETIRAKEALKNHILKSKSEDFEECFPIEDDGHFKEQAIKIFNENKKENEKAKESYLKRGCILIIEEEEDLQEFSLKDFFKSVNRSQVKEMIQDLEKDKYFKSQFLDKLKMPYNRDLNRDEVIFLGDTEDEEILFFVIENTKIKTEVIEWLLIQNIEYEKPLNESSEFIEIPKGEDFNQGIKIKLNDSRFLDDGTLSPFFNRKSLEDIYNNIIFKKTLINEIKKLLKLEFNLSKTKIQVNITDKAEGDFEVFIFDTNPSAN